MKSGKKNNTLAHGTSCRIFRLMGQEFYLLINRGKSCDWTTQAKIAKSTSCMTKHKVSTTQALYKKESIEVIEIHN